MRERVLVIEDDLEMQGLIKEWLREAGFEPLVASDGPEGLRYLYGSRPSVVLLDIMLPRVDGWEVCRRIRDVSDIPVIMLTARTKQTDILKGFDAGADDYLTKPFEFRELVARIRAVLRRSPSSAEVELSSFKWNDLEVDFRTHRVSLSGRAVSLSPTEFRILSCLIRNQSRVVNHEQLLLSAWGSAYIKEKEYLKLYIHYLRKKLEEDPERPRYIVTERGVGYRFATEAQPM